MRGGSELMGALGPSWHRADLKCFTSRGCERITCRKGYDTTGLLLGSSSVTAEPPSSKKVSEMGAVGD